MSLRVLDTVCEPGGAKPNEDRVGAAADAAWVIDGATDVYPEPFLPATNDVHYLVDGLGNELRRALRPAVDVERTLTEISAEIGRDIRGHGFPADRVYPTCSVGLAIDHGGTLELARIGDATLVAVGEEVDSGEDAGVTELSTVFYNQRETAAVRAAGPQGLDAQDARDALLLRRREYITGVHPEGVFSGDPSAVLRIHRVRLKWNAARHVLLCTDGFARAITDYGLYSNWRDLIDAALRDSLATVTKAIRDCERQPDFSASRRHFKRSDDIAAALCEKKQGA
ncbi:protein phosphatase 2C domain-containing protein [Actinospica durhamensis]|uniref:Protein phosphatase 2C domain-containing protein n=1 Tax=Actinospica durhamensis TaxID=1508375 RepID=A0A941IV21_9ACTN|nr:protein phosphatase 2C domain-containing protein [Actinospica durhamensis]MBR7838423.1 protein phosphatase 2C domain-containing protein [Actinospica durhamensis]